RCMGGDFALNIADFTVFRNVEGEITAHATGRAETTEESVLADIDIWKEGELAAWISGLRMNRLLTDARLDGRIYEVQWREKEPGVLLRAIGGNWLVLSDDAAASQQLSQSLGQRGCSVVVRPSRGALDIFDLRAIAGLFA